MITEDEAVNLLRDIHELQQEINKSNDPNEKMDLQQLLDRLREFYATEWLGSQ